MPLVCNGTLCYLYCKMDVMVHDTLVKMCTDHFVFKDIEAARQLLYSYDAITKLNLKENRRRQGPAKDKTKVSQCLPIYQRGLDRRKHDKVARTHPWSHFIRNKPIRFGLKVYMLAEAKTGYVINIDLAQTDNTVLAGQKIVTTMINICVPYHDLGYHLCMDNWTLASDCVSVCGTGHGSVVASL